MLKIDENKVKKDKKIVDAGFKINENLRMEILNKIETLEDKNRQDILMWIIAGKCGFKKFKNFNYLKNNLSKLDTILKNESAFETGLGLNLVEFFNLKPNNIIIFEDIEGFGRIIKEKNCSEDIYNNSGEGNNESKIISYIPVFNAEGDFEYKNLVCNIESGNVDSDIKFFNNLAEKNYDAIEGLVYSM